MSNLSKLEFVALDISGNNYMTYVLDAEIYLAAKGLGNTIIKGKESSNQDKAKAMIFLRHHLHEGLKTEYLTVKDPLELWNNLKERYDHLKLRVLPKARHEWMHFRFQDFKTVSDYNSVVFRITSQLKLCGEPISDENILEKTLSIFHASNMVLQQQYRERGFKKYSELITCLLVAEQNNTTLMKNHESPPTGSAPFLEVNVVAAYDKSERRQNNYRGRGHSRGHGRGRRCGRGRYNYRHPGVKIQENNKGSQNYPSKVKDNVCHRCGTKGHRARVCRTPEHFVKIYQSSLKRKQNNVEANWTFQNNDYEINLANNLADKEANAYINDDFEGLANLTHLKAGDFFEDNN